MEKMLKKLNGATKKMKYKHVNKDMILTIDEERNFKNADECYICNKNTLQKTFV